MMLIGPTRSGKGVIGRVFTGMVGRNSVGAPTLAGLSTNFGLEPLIDKPVAIISDARLGSRADQAVIAERLLSISGEDMLTIDRKYRSAWTGRLPTKFMLLTNELPRFIDASGALPKRFIIVMLKRSFYDAEDQALTGKLLTELPAIFNWARHGYRRLNARGHFVQPGSAREAIEDLETLGSPIKAFVREECDIGPGKEVQKDLLYAEWKKWCANNERKPNAENVFSRDLRTAFPAISKRYPRDDHGRTLIYTGIALK